jgi:hypothetical protein
VTLNSGADVSIGGKEFFLDNSVEEPYSHVLESLYSDTQKISGSDAVTANPNVLLWTYDDFAGGAENKFYSEVIPDTYWYGNNNPRVRGAITAPPDTAQATKTLTTTSTTKWLFTVVAQKVWAAAGRDLFYSTDGASWTQWNSTSLFGASYLIDGLTHDGAHPWVTATDGTTRKVKKVTSTTTETTAVADRTTSEPCFGLAMLEGNVYLWTGASLYSYDTTASLPITQVASNTAHNPFVEGGSYGGIAASENSIFYFTSGTGVTHMFEYRFSSTTNSFIPRPVWNPAPGFTGRHVACSMGVVYILGDYGSQIALFGMSQVNREPLFLSLVGQAYGGDAVTLTASALAPSYGAQMLVGIRTATTNYYFVYDAEIDSMSQLDEQTITTDGSNYAMVTYVNKRIAVGNGADTTGKFRSWGMDYDTPTRGWTWTGSAWSVGYPMDEKLLFGFQVTQDPTIVAGTVQVEYQIDESGSWVSAGTTSAGVKYTNFDLSANNIKFRILRVRMTGAFGARCFSVTGRCYINSYQELWRMVVKLRDEKPNASLTGRPTNRQLKAEKLRGYLNTLASDKSVVTFLDGRSSSRKGVYETHVVVVEFPRYGGSRIHRAKGHYEGSAEIVLRSTAP